MTCRLFVGLCRILPKFEGEKQKGALSVVQEEEAVEAFGGVGRRFEAIPAQPFPIHPHERAMEAREEAEVEAGHHVAAPVRSCHRA